MEKRWKISLDGGANYDTIVTPLNAVKFSWSRDLNAGQIFFRTKLGSKVEFGGEYFNLFYSWERTSVRRCNDIFIRQYRLCEGQWKVFWTGRFSAGAGSYDLDQCRFEVKPEVVDKYTCILDKAEFKVNTMEAAWVEATAAILPSVQFFQCVTDDNGSEALCTFLNGEPGWIEIHTQPLFLGFSNPVLHLYWRELSNYPCQDGVPVAPPGVGWIMIEDNCAATGTALWTREPTIAYTYGNMVQGSCSGSTSIPPSGGTECNWVRVGGAACGVPHFVGSNTYNFSPFYVCITGFSIDTARTLSSVIDLMRARVECGMNQVVSDFFEMNPEGDAPGYSPGINYITGGVNQVNQLVWIQKSDAIDPGAINPATLGELTFKELFDALRKMFNVFWDIDDNGNLRLEHWHYWISPQGLDLTVGENARINQGMNRYEHTSGEIPSRERFTWAEAEAKDFIGADIIYDSACVSKEDRDAVEETNISIITTDIALVVNAPDTIARTGFVLLATTFDGSSYNTIIDDGALTGTSIANAPLSWANLHRDYFTWNRYLKRGNLNGQDVIFDGIMPNIQQAALRAEFCCGMEEWDAKDTVKTELGERFLNQRQGYVEKAELDDTTNMLTLTLRYAY